MGDPVEIRIRIEVLRERLSRRDAYGELLATEKVVRHAEDVAAWRADIRVQARADRMKVRTGANGCWAYALLLRRPSDDDTNAHNAALTEMAKAADANRHEPVFVASHHSEILVGCERCPALGYADTQDEVLGGSLLDTGCPHEEEPEVTAFGLAWS